MKFAYGRVYGRESSCGAVCTDMHKKEGMQEGRANLSRHQFALHRKSGSMTNWQ